MAGRSRRCPVCQDSGQVDENLKCQRCGGLLGYVDVSGTLGVLPESIPCRRCGTRNSLKVIYCESCGMQVNMNCPLCGGMHPVGSRVCAKTGEPLKVPAHEWNLPSVLRESISILFARHSRAFLIPLLLVGLAIAYGYHLSQQKHGTAVFYPPTRPKMDVAFVVDSTGSMADEIEVVKSKIRGMMAKIRSGQPRPDVRFAIVAYRDRGDEYVTRNLPFTDDMDRISSYVNTIEADGGGDTKESVNESLHVALQGLPWDESQNTRKLIFLIGDAGPHMDYSNDTTYLEECAFAKKKGIKIHTIGCSGIEEDGEKEFKEIAFATGGDFEYLTYKEQYADREGKTFYYVKLGKERYTLSKDAKEDDWREGAAVLKIRGLATKAPEVPTAMGDHAGAIFAPAPMRVENNLDAVLTRQVQKEAEAAGVKY